VAPSVIDVEGRAIDPGVVRHSPIRIGVATMNRVLQRFPECAPRIHRPRERTPCIPRRSINYKVQSSDIRRMREENPFMLSKFEVVDDRFWSQFHKDYYESVCMKDGIHGLTTPII
jgi:hypothetical protein